MNQETRDVECAKRHRICGMTTGAEGTSTRSAFFKLVDDCLSDVRVSLSLLVDDEDELVVPPKSFGSPRKREREKKKNASSSDPVFGSTYKIPSYMSE